MNIDKLGFRTLTTYLMVKETHPDDKKGIALRIVQECGLGYNQIDWVLDYNWIGGEGSTAIIKAWKGTSLTRLERAEELIKIASELADRTTFDEIEIAGEWVSTTDLHILCEQYLEEFVNE